MKRSEFVAGIVVPNGESVGQIELKPDAGKIIGVVVYSKGDNPGMVRATLRTSQGKELIQLQPVENLRSRDVAFNMDGKPVDFSGGVALIFQIVATQPMNGEYLADVVLIYDQDETETAASC